MGQKLGPSSRTHLGRHDPSAHVEPGMALLRVVERVADCAQHVRKPIVVVGLPEAGVARLLLCRTILQNWLQ
eukprot:5638458-Prymnesium_polylepis.1